MFCLNKNFNITPNLKSCIHLNNRIIVILSAKRFYKQYCNSKNLSLSFELRHNYQNVPKHYYCWLCLCVNLKKLSSFKLCMIHIYVVIEYRVAFKQQNDIF